MTQHSSAAGSTRLARQGFAGGEGFETNADSRPARSGTGHFVLHRTFVKPAFTISAQSMSASPISLAWELFVIALDAASNPASDPIVGEADIVRRFLSWMQRARTEERADAVSALARAYLHSRLPEAVRSEAVVALTSVLDDPSALVRRALAEALASASNAPRHIVLGLASDQSEVSRIVLALSPVLDDSELVDCAAIGDAAAQIAVARRPHLPPGVADTLAEMGERPAVLALAGNLDAELTNAALRRIFDRFGEDPAVREKLSMRAGLPAALRVDIAAATSRALAQVASSRDWLNPRRAGAGDRRHRPHLPPVGTRGTRGAAARERRIDRGSADARTGQRRFRSVPADAGRNVRAARGSRRWLLSQFSWTGLRRALRQGRLARAFPARVPRRARRPRRRRKPARQPDLAQFDHALDSRVRKTRRPESRADSVDAVALRLRERARRRAGVRGRRRHAGDGAVDTAGRTRGHRTGRLGSPAAHRARQRSPGREFRAARRIGARGAHRIGACAAREGRRRGVMRRMDFR